MLKFEKCKLLRRSLNVQTGKEVGHQDGRRHQPNDPGYLIIRKWGLNQLEHRSQLGTAPATTPAAAE